MKGKPEVLEILQKMLSEELHALNQYMLHTEIQSNWGFKRLCKEIKKQAIEEMKHAEKLIERILFLEGTPDLNALPKLNIGKDIKQQLKNDLELEKGAVAAYNEAIATARKAGDNVSADLFFNLLSDEEGHVDFLETQLSLADQIGLENYLVEQMHE